MATGAAADALQRAAARAQRLIALEVAHHTIEKTLGYEIQEEQAPWMSVLSKPYIGTKYALADLVCIRLDAMKLLILLVVSS